MVEIKARLAGTPVRICALFESTRDFLREYLTEEEPQLTVSVTQEDLEREKLKSAESRAEEGLPPISFGEAYLETLAVYRKLAERLLERDILLFHGSAVAVDGQAYLFTARSGTGKSTHARLWRELFGERAVMINDDKPLLSVGEDGVRVYGTPWNGKHHLGGNRSAPLKALCILTRDTRNHIEAIRLEDAFPTMVQQCYRPEDGAKIPALLSLLERMGRTVKLYRLGCNMDPEAARISYQGMQEEN